MQIQINTDRNIDGNETLAMQVRGVVVNTLGRFSDRITRVEVHLSDENSDQKHGTNDKRCMIEARLEGQQPIAVTHHATTIYFAVDGAVAKLSSSIESTVGRLREHRTPQR